MNWVLRVLCCVLVVLVIAGLYNGAMLIYYTGHGEGFWMGMDAGEALHSGRPLEEEELEAGKTYQVRNFFMRVVGPDQKFILHLSEVDGEESSIEPRHYFATPDLLKIFIYVPKEGARFTVKEVDGKRQYSLIPD